MSAKENGEASDSGASTASLLNDFKDSEDISTSNLDAETIPSVASNEKVENETEKDDKSEKPEWDDLLGSGAILKKILKEGTPDSRPKRLQTAVIRYKSTLEDGTLIEDITEQKIQIGDFETLQGLDVAIGLMNIGEVCQLKIEPRLAYGSKGLEPCVGPETVVHFEVELKAVEDEVEPETLTIAQRKELGNKKRERGNWWYGRGENQLAIQCYRRALDYLDEVEGGIKDPTADGQPEITDAALQDLLEDRVSVCNNMAAAQLKMGLHDAALNSLQKVLRCQPNNIKALFRKSKVFRAKNDIPTALTCLQKANEVSPNNPDIQKEMASLQSLLQKQKISERELARRMFNGTKSKENKMSKKDANKIFMWGTLGLSLVVGVLGFAAYKFKLT